MKRAQSSLEFAVVIAAVVVALLVMQVYIKRSLQGRLRQSADELSQQQYEPKNTVSDMTITQNSDITTDTNTEDTGTQYKATSTTIINSQSEHRVGNETILP